MVNVTASVLIVASLLGAVPSAKSQPVHSTLRASMIDVVRNLPSPSPALPAPAVAPPHGKRSGARIATGILLGAAAGTFAGGFVGYKIERGFADCRCDDPGIRGLFIGAPIGAVIGAIVGGKFF